MIQGWWVTDAWATNPVILVAWVFWVVFSIVLHELGHGIAAIRCGDRTPIDTGHMTWSPMVHMGPTALIMFALFGFTWGAMPVTPSRFRGRFDDAKVAAAGPAVNLSLGLLCVVAAVAWQGLSSGVNPEFREKIFTFFWVGARINAMGVLFNLLPVPPLDGSRIVANFFPAYDRFFTTERGGMVGLIAAVLLFTVGGKYVWALADLGAALPIVWLAARFGVNLP